MPKKSSRKYAKRTRKSSKKAKKSGTFNTRVQRAVQSFAELKRITHFQDVTGFNNTISGGGDTLRLLPDIAQGTGGNARIGDAIRLRKIVVRGHFVLTQAFTFATTRFIIRHMVLRNRRYASWADNVTFNTLLANYQPFVGSVPNVYIDLNKDLYAVKKDKKYDMKTPLTNLGATSTSDAVQSVRMFKFTMKFGKTGLLLNFENNASYPSNFPWFMLAAYVNTDGSVSNSTATPLGLAYNTEAYFNDV